jgi:hypothetical protein
VLVGVSIGSVVAEVQAVSNIHVKQISVKKLCISLLLKREPFLIIAETSG